jgi:hypothetical protein
VAGFESEGEEEGEEEADVHIRQGYSGGEFGSGEVSEE